MKNDHVAFQRRPFFTPLWLSGIAAIVGLVLLLLAAWQWVHADVTIVIVIRPAERVAVGDGDPRLTATGLQRAALLARMLGDRKLFGHIDAIYLSSAPGDRMTVAPLARELGVAPMLVSGENSDRLAHRVLREHRGGRILIVEPVPKVPEIVGALGGGEQMGPIGDEEYGTMYIVSVPHVGRANILRVNY